MPSRKFASPASETGPQRAIPSLMQTMRSVPPDRSVRAQAMEQTYSMVGSKISSYEEEFREVLGSDTITSIVSRSQRPVVVDLMATPSTLMDLFEKARVPGAKGISVSYNTHPYSTHYGHHNITEIGGDLVKKATWRDIKAVMAGNKATLVMERARAGLSTMPRSLPFYAVMINRAWSLLDPNGGTLLLEAPLVHAGDRNALTSQNLAKWEALLRSNGISVSLQPNTYYSLRPTIRLERKKGDPPKLPFLEGRELLRKD